MNRKRLWRTKRKNKIKQNKKELLLGQIELCCALSLVLGLFVGISPISDKAKVRFMYVGAALSLIAVPIMSHYIAGLNNIVDELRYQAVLVFIVAVCCYCFVMANMVKYNVMKKKVAVLEGTLEKLEQERAAAIYAGRTTRCSNV